ncbi:MAG: MFS transporter [Catenulispora sp.]|nr:MFS transporter [Catenulispora sp.]
MAADGGPGFIRRHQARGSDLGDFGRFWSARTLSILGDQIAAVAMTAYSYELSRSAAVTGMMVAALTVPRLISPFAGAVADRSEARAVMLRLDLAQAAVVAVIALVDRSVPVLLAGATVLTLLAAFHLPAGRRSIALLAPAEQTGRAYAAIGVSWNLGWAAGPALGSGLLALGGFRWALGADLVSFLISALLVRRLPALPPADSAMGESGTAGLAQVAHSLRVGLGCLVRTPQLRAVALNLVCVVGLGSIDTVALITLTARTLGSGQAGYALLASAAGVGMLCGSLVVAGLRELDAAALLVGGQACVAAGLAATGAAPDQLAAMAAQALMGIGNGVENVGSDIITQQAAPQEVIGTVSGAMSVAPYLGYLIGSVTAPLLVGALGPRGALFAIAPGVLLAALGVRIALRGKPSGRRCNFHRAPRR